MGDRVLAVSEMSRAVSSEMVVLGWVDMPFAEACSICGVSNFMLMLMDEPELAREVLEFLTGAVKVFASAQIDAGADMIGAGDAAASLLSKEMYADFVLPYEKEIIDDIHARGKPAKLHICGNTEHIIEEMAESGADLYNVDSAVDFSRAKAIYSGRGKCFKGNLDPVGEIMQKSAAECEKLAHNCIASSGGAGYMLSAGCEIPAETPDEVFGAFCGAARTFNGIRPGG